MSSVEELEVSKEPSINRILQECFSVTEDYNGQKIHFGISDLVSYLNIVPFSVEVDNVTYQCGGLGAIATLPTFRKNGHASMLIDHAICWMEDRKYDFVVLYGAPEFYGRFGFALVFEESQMMVKILNSEIDKDIVFSNLGVWKNIPVF